VLYDSDMGEVAHLSHLAYPTVTLILATAERLTRPPEGYNDALDDLSKRGASVVTDTGLDGVSMPLPGALIIDTDDQKDRGSVVDAARLACFEMRRTDMVWEGLTGEEDEDEDEVEERLYAEQELADLLAELDHPRPPAVSEADWAAAVAAVEARVAATLNAHEHFYPQEAAAAPARARPDQPPPGSTAARLPGRGAPAFLACGRRSLDRALRVLTGLDPLPADVGDVGNIAAAVSTSFDAMLGILGRSIASVEAALAAAAAAPARPQQAAAPAPDPVAAQPAGGFNRDAATAVLDPAKCAAATPHFIMLKAALQGARTALFGAVQGARADAVARLNAAGMAPVPLHLEDFGHGLRVFLAGDQAVIVRAGPVVFDHLERLMDEADDVPEEGGNNVRARLFATHILALRAQIRSLAVCDVLWGADRLMNFLGLRAGACRAFQAIVGRDPLQTPLQTPSEGVVSDAALADAALAFGDAADLMVRDLHSHGRTDVVFMLRLSWGVNNRSPEPASEVRDGMV